MTKRRSGITNDLDRRLREHRRRFGDTPNLRTRFLGSREDAIEWEARQRAHGLRAPAGGRVPNVDGPYFGYSFDEPASALESAATVAVAGAAAYGLYRFIKWALTPPLGHAR